MTLRELYNYVLAAISKRPKGPATEHGKSTKRANVTPVPSVLDVKHHTESFVSALGGSIGSTEKKQNKDGESDNKVEQVSESEQQHASGSARDSSGKKVEFDLLDVPSTAAVAPLGPAGNITYRDRLGGYLHPRDMRRLVTPFSSSNSQEIMVRRHCILLNCDPLRAIVLRDRLLLLVPDDSEAMLETLAKRILGGREEMEDSVFGTSPTTESGRSQKETSSRDDKGGLFSGLTGHGKKKDSKQSDSGVSDATVEETEDESDEDSMADEWEDLQGGRWIDLPFELKAVDAVLQTVSIMLAEDVELLQEAVYDTIDEVLNNGNALVGDQDQKILRALKNEIKEMNARVDNFVRAITEALDDLEDLSLMNLSRLITHPELFIQPVPRAVLEEESDEPELILEVFMQQALSIHNQLDLLKSQVTTSEELMAMQLDTVRNRLLLIDAIISIVSLTVSIAALVGSIYGMNVIIGVEDDPNAFTKIVAGSSVACVILLLLFLFIFYRALALPNVNNIAY
jgi:magnesium transporter